MSFEDLLEYLSNNDVEHAKMLLEIPSVRENAAVEHNYALRLSSFFGHTKIAEMLLISKVPMSEVYQEF